MGKGLIVNCFYDGCISGFGDFLRGSLHLYERSKFYKLKFDIDISHHPINKYIGLESKYLYDKSEIECIPTKVHLESIMNAHLRTKKYIHDILVRASNSEITYLFSNFDHIFNIRSPLLTDAINNSNPLDKKTSKWFIKKLKFSDQINNTAESELKNAGLKHKGFNIIHFRLGDENSFHEGVESEFYVPQNSSCFDICIEKLESTKYKMPLVVLSDSNDIKNYIKNKSKKLNLPIHVFHLQSNHMQKKTNLDKKLKEIKYTEENLFYTVLDMKLITMANRVDSFSVYCWGSGFITWICKIYGVPFKIEEFQKNK